jgi:adenosylhomocysteine nucleosidase
MRVLVTFALPSEFAPWRDRNGFRRCPLRGLAAQAPGGNQVYAAQVGDCRVDVLLTGVGWRGAKWALQSALQADVDLCVSAGLAGGLRQGLRIGDVVAARRAVARSTGAQVASTASLLAAAAACGAKTADVSLTSDELAVTSRQKRELAAHGDIVEMESCHVLRAAAAANVPALVARAISDTVDEDLPMNFDLLMDAAGGLSMRRLLVSLGREPGKIPALARFGMKSRRAVESLGSFLDRFVGYVGAHSETAEGMAWRVVAQ